MWGICLYFVACLVQKPLPSHFVLGDEAVLGPAIAPALATSQIELLQARMLKLILMNSNITSFIGLVSVDFLQSCWLWAYLAKSAQAKLKEVGYD